MDLTLLWTVFLWLLASLAVLAVSVIWIVILAATWSTVSRFLSEYKQAGAVLEREEAEAEEAKARENPDYYRK